ncbi:hypothetical protein AMK22_22695 [Streptomyces sp. CB01580]|nr:hypothetical protein AMK22_22695 [Streptomyces sp. CB01580]
MHRPSGHTGDGPGAAVARNHERRLPVAEVPAWCAMVLFVRWFLYSRFARVRGRHGSPLTARSTIR